MKVKTSFLMFGEFYKLTLDTNNIDRNYDDESYAYWIIERDGHFFEVNIWKDESGNFTNKGKVYGFSDREEFENAGDADEETDIAFVLYKCLEKSIKIEGGISLNVNNGDFSAAQLLIDGEEKYFCADTPRKLLAKIGKYILKQSFT